jgi:hypothetical protein
VSPQRRFSFDNEKARKKTTATATTQQRLQQRQQ